MRSIAGHPAVTSALIAGAIVCSSNLTFGDAFKPTVERDFERSGLDYHRFRPAAADYRYCLSACYADTICHAWAYSPPPKDGFPTCWLKYDVPSAKSVRGVIGGIVRPPSAMPAKSLTSLSYQATGGNVLLKGKLVRNEGKRWTERNDHGQWSFYSISENDAELVLYDSRRDIYLYADLKAHKIYTRQGMLQDWRPLYAVTSVQ